MPKSIQVVNWIIDFLSNRSQRIKLGEGYVSEWKSVPSGVSQGTKLGPWLFLIMINDLVVENACLWKYIDDTTISETVAKGEPSSWAVQLNTDKCKEIWISFTKSQQEFEPILVKGDGLEVVDSVKLLGLNIFSDLTWNIHINEILKKSSKRLYFLVQLKRAKVTCTGLGLFYSSCIRSIMDHAIPACHFSLAKYLMQELERIQKRAMSIICPRVSYHEVLVIMNFKELATHHDEICESLFHTIVNDNNHHLYKLLPALHKSIYSLRCMWLFNMPRFKTNHFKNSFIIFSCLKASILIG